MASLIKTTPILLGIEAKKFHQKMEAPNKIKRKTISSIKSNAASLKLILKRSK